ncbi:DUF2306 domain-containing protein [Rhodothalassium salexigens]|uniref:DUF2306 domain-containing protein n=1 Tax=Rhodothalassium salexigens TaxID=1086 RepID=UPI001911B1AD
MHSSIGGLHMIAALVALVTGPVVFWRPKGAGAHRLWGYGFTLAMLAVNISALGMYQLSGAPNLFHAFAVLSLTALLPGFWYIQRAVRTGEVACLETHARLMMWAYAGLVFAGLAQLGTRLLPLWLDDWRAVGVTIAVTVGVVSMAVAWMIRRAAPAMAARYAPILRGRRVAGRPVDAVE